MVWIGFECVPQRFMFWELVLVVLGDEVEPFRGAA